MSNAIEKLLQDKPAVIDGAWGTQLQARGLPIGACPDEWNLTNPGRVEEVAKAYVAAGSQMILSNTFGANRLTLERYGLADRAREIALEGIRISRRAAGEGVFVFGSLGPSGKMLAMGEVSEDDLRAAFAEEAAAMAEGGADGVVIETMSDLDEAVLAVESACVTGLPVVASMVYDAGKAGDRTMMGNTPEQAAERLAAAGASVIGTNCGKGAKQMLPIAERLRAATTLPIWIKPNAGLPELVNGAAVYKSTPQEFVEQVLAIVDAGADFVGGCCGTTPEHICALVSALSAKGGAA